MGLKGKWKDKINDVDGINAEDINVIANAVIEIEEGGFKGESDAVKYTEQSLSEEQRAQARKNIDAVNPNGVVELIHENVETISEDELLEWMASDGIVIPVVSADGEFYTNNQNQIFIL